MLPTSEGSLPLQTQEFCADFLYNGSAFSDWDCNPLCLSTWGCECEVDSVLREAAIVFVGFNLFIQNTFVKCLLNTKPSIPVHKEERQFLF